MFAASCGSSSGTTEDSTEDARERPRTDVIADATDDNEETGDAALSDEVDFVDTEIVDGSGEDSADVPIGTDADDTLAELDDLTGDTDDASNDVADAEDGTEDLSDTSPDADEACLDFTLRASGEVRPVDIIWAIDASPSMGDEIDRVESELNIFATQIGGSGLDYQVVLIGSDREQSILAEAHDFYEICVPPPLSGADGCPDSDSERYLHVREPIHSREALSETIATHGQWRSRVRPNSTVHFVIVTDDNERGSAAVTNFTNFANTTAGFLGRWKLHSIVDLVESPESCAFDDTCSCGDGQGAVYMELARATSGLQLSICEANWSPLLSQLAADVADSASVPCTFLLPTPGEQYEVDYAAVSLRQITVGGDTALERVADAGECTAVGGWYYDNADAPTRILLCPSSCEASSTALEVDMECVRIKQ